MDDPEEMLLERVQQEKVAAMVESIIKTADDIDYRILDDLCSPDTLDGVNLRSFLNSLEMLGLHWGTVNKAKYSHRLQMYE